MEHMTDNELKNECKVTIGMPLYNVEDYVRQSLTCALEQDLDNVEILVVDDCGKDKSLEIVKEIQKNHHKGNSIRIINHHENLGIGAVRNTILKEARGKYLFFLDSDDLIPSFALRVLYTNAETHKAEVTYGSTNVIEEDKTSPFMQLTQRYLEGEDALVLYIYNDIRENLLNSVWNILIRTDFIRNNNLTFPLYRGGEDWFFNEQMQPKVTRALLLPDITYYYRKRPNSLMNFQKRDTISIREAFGSIRGIDEKKNYCQALKYKPYYDRKCAKTMKRAFYSVCGIINHRHQFDGEISNKQLRHAMRHPASLCTILRFKHQKTLNLLFWFMGELPSNLAVAIVTVFGKRKGLIR